MWFPELPHFLDSNVQFQWKFTRYTKKLESVTHSKEKKKNCYIKRPDSKYTRKTLKNNIIKDAQRYTVKTDIWKKSKYE